VFLKVYMCCVCAVFVHMCCALCAMASSQERDNVLGGFVRKIQQIEANEAAAEVRAGVWCDCDLACARRHDSRRRCKIPRRSWRRSTR
jgi:hypothetical protein